MLACGPNCGCERHGPLSGGLAGWMATALNVAAAAVGVPVPVGTIAAAGATPGYGPITQTPDQIAKAVAPKVADAISHPAKGPADARSMAVAQASAAQIAQSLAQSGYMFPAGTTGAQLQHPDPFAAFGGNSGQLVRIGFAGLGVLLLLKTLK